MKIEERDDPAFWCQRERELCDQKTQKQLTKADFDRRAAEQLAEGHPVVNREGDRLEREIAGLDPAIDIVYERWAAAIRSEYRAQAAAKRAEAQQRRGEPPLDFREVSPILGLPWTPAMQLEAEAAELERQAERGPTQNGVVRGHSAQDLVEAVLADPMRLGPRVDAVRERVAQTELAERERRRRSPVSNTAANYRDPEARLEFELEWSSPQQFAVSVVQEPEAPPPVDPLVWEGSGAQDRARREQLVAANRAREIRIGETYDAPPPPLQGWEGLRSSR